MEENAWHVLDRVLCDEFEKDLVEIIRIGSAQVKSPEAAKTIRAGIERITSQETTLGSSVLYALIASLNQGLRCVHDSEAASRLSESYLSFISKLNSTEQYLAKQFAHKPEMKSALAQLAAVKNTIDERALCLFSAVTRNKECAAKVAQSGLFGHFLFACGSAIRSSSSTLFVAAVLVYNVLFSTEDIVLVLRFE